MLREELWNLLRAIFSFEEDPYLGRIIAIGIISIVMIILWIWINKSDEEKK